MALRIGLSDDYDKAELHLTIALRLRTTNLGPRHRRSIESTIELVRLRRRQGDYPAAEELAREGLQFAEAALEPDDPVRLQMQASLAQVLYRRAKLPEAERLLRAVLAGRQQARWAV